MEPFWAEWRRAVLHWPRTVIDWLVLAVRGYLTIGFTFADIGKVVQGDPATKIGTTVLTAALLWCIWVLPRWSVRRGRRVLLSLSFTRAYAQEHWPEMPAYPPPPQNDEWYDC